MHINLHSSLPLQLTLCIDVAFMGGFTEFGTLNIVSSMLATANALHTTKCGESMDMLDDIASIDMASPGTVSDGSSQSSYEAMADDIGVLSV